MKFADISNIRLQQQQIAPKQYKNAQEIVQWMGAIQAQDYSMAKWALGSRIIDSTDILIENDFNNGDIIRTHILRPTWHFVSAKDIYWMLELTAPHIRPLLKSELKRLEITNSIIIKSIAILENILEDKKYLTREEIVAHFEKAGIRSDENRISHLMMNAELDKIICSGPIKQKKQTYALFEQKIKQKNKLPREEALSKLAQIYFRSHGPATIHDFAWWSGLPVKDARNAVEINKTNLISEIVNDKIFWYSESAIISSDKNKSTFLLPAFDEYLISYKNREACINSEYNSKAISNNGIFRPIIVINGQVSGIWKRTTKNEKANIETTFFRKHSKTEMNEIANTAENYGKFANKKIEIIFDKTF